MTWSDEGTGSPVDVSDCSTVPCKGQAKRHPFLPPALLVFFPHTRLIGRTLSMSPFIASLSPYLFWDFPPVMLVPFDWEEAKATIRAAVEAYA